MGLTHGDVIVSVDDACVIDVTTRKIIVHSPDTGIAQYDHNSKRITFTIKRNVNGHDMSEVDRIAIKYLNVKKSDMYIVNDAAVSDDGESVTFTWLVSGNVTQEVGSLVFLINFRCYSDDGTITYNWSTQPCSTYSILKGVNSMDSNPQELYDFWTRYQSMVYEVAEDAEDARSLARILVNDVKTLRTVVESLTISSDSLDSTVDKMSKDVPVLENKVKSLQNGIPNLETRVKSLERTLDDEPIQAVNQEVSDIKTSISNRGEIKYELNYKTAVDGVPHEYEDHGRLMITEMVDCLNKIRIVNNSIDYIFGVVCYENDKTWSGADPGWINAREYFIREYGYAYVNFKRVDGKAFTDADIERVKESIKIYRTDLDVAKESDMIEVERSLNTVVNKCDFNSYPLEYGTLSVGVMQPGTPTRLYTPEYIRVRKGMYVSFNSTEYFFGVNVFDNNKVHDGADRPWRQNDFYIDFDGYILMNFRKSDNSNLQESDKVAIREICYIKNYVKYDEDLILATTKRNEYETIKETAISSISVEYGRLNGASYIYCRIPKVLNDGRSIIPRVKLTSRDGSIYGTTRSTLQYARDMDSIFTVNAGLFDMSTNLPLGQTIIDGVSIVNSRHPQGANGETISDTECYSLCIDANGKLSAPYDNEVDTSTMINDGVVDAVGGWGILVDNYAIAMDEIEAEIVHPGKYIRQSIGQYQNGDYAVCTVDMSRGSVENEAGITYEALAQLFVDRGVKFAYSLDGGGSAETVLGKRQLNPIYEGTVGRAVPTVITFEIAD